MKSILVVCEGNICRSPMAAGLLAAALPKTKIHSAGLNSLSGMPADETAVRLMQARGIDISSHRAMQITRESCQTADLALVMSTEQRQYVEHHYPFACGRVYRLCEFSKRDVPDPYGRPEWAFRECLSIIDEGVRDWLLRIQKL
jgi:protein-tyrosine phosphatase